ncbi:MULTISPECIES: type II secretion system protein [unclassified Cetobacterium]|uniref:type II secretion system protein n=1 Tax=unclassified Cetobacterium TaxID=2630983 RepID=UPI000647C718|nr:MULTISPECIES: type II secretion system protein [unclassified Cetobacterium]
MKRREGFSVIEIILVLGVIGILSSFIVPKVRDYLAMAKDSKAINTLQNLRVASETYYLEKGSYPWPSTGITNMSEVLENLENYIGKNKVPKPGDGDDLLLEIGGSKSTPDGEITYGGEVKVNLDTGNTHFILTPKDSKQEYNIRGEKWEDI